MYRFKLLVTVQDIEGYEPLDDDEKIWLDACTEFQPRIGMILLVPVFYRSVDEEDAVKRTLDSHDVKVVSIHVPIDGSRPMVWAITIDESENDAVSSIDDIKCGVREMVRLANANREQDESEFVRRRGNYRRLPCREI